MLFKILFMLGALQFVLVYTLSDFLNVAERFASLKIVCGHDSTAPTLMCIALYNDIKANLMIY